MLVERWRLQQRHLSHTKIRLLLSCDILIRITIRLLEQINYFNFEHNNNIIGLINIIIPNQTSGAMAEWHRRLPVPEKGGFKSHKGVFVNAVIYIST